MPTLIRGGGGSSAKFEGTATEAQVLSGATFYSDDKDIKTGTMTNRGAVTQALNCGGSYTIPKGYHNGSGKVTANSLASQTSGTATASQMLSGATAWVGGAKITGNIPTYGNTASTPYNMDQYGNIGFITNKAGYYPANTIFYNSASSCNILSENIASGKSIFGVSGTFSGCKVEFLGYKQVSFSTQSGTTTTITINASDFGLSNANNMYVICDVDGSASTSYYVNTIDSITRGTSAVTMKVTGASGSGSTKKVYVGVFKVENATKVTQGIANGVTSFTYIPTSKYVDIIATSYADSYSHGLLVGDYNNNTKTYRYRTNSSYYSSLAYIAIE